MLNLGIYLFHVCFKKSEIGVIHTMGTNANTTGTNTQTKGQFLHNGALSGVPSHCCGGCILLMCIAF